MEDMVSFWKGKKVLVTGASGFKGAWLTLWLLMKEAKVFCYSLNVPTKPALWDMLDIKKDVDRYEWNDIRNLTGLRYFITQVKPDIVFHMAAQAILKDGIIYPVETFNINAMGTVNLLEACRDTVSGPIIVITTDKVYENQWWNWGYRETDPLGASEPYSTSKVCSEYIANCYKQTFYKNNQIATVRAGNVIGPGDYQYRVVPMIMESLLKDESPKIWDPKAIRPWQHVLDCLNGYMILAKELHKEPYLLADAWNFGPEETDILSVGDLTKKILEFWNKVKASNIKYIETDCPDKYPLKIDLRVNSTNAWRVLGWKRKWDIDKIVSNLCLWNILLEDGVSARKLCEDTIRDFEKE